MDTQDCGCGGITPLIYTDQIPDEVFVVTTKRRDGTQPKVCKTIGQMWHSTQREAKDFLNEFPEKERSCYGVFRAHVIILDEVTNLE